MFGKWIILREGDRAASLRIHRISIYGTTHTGNTSRTTPTHPLATTGPMNKSSVTAAPGQSCRIEFTPSVHVRTPVATLQTTGVSLSLWTWAGVSKWRSWRPVL